MRYVAIVMMMFALAAVAADKPTADQCKRDPSLPGCASK